MKAPLVIAAVALASVLFTAWINGVFRRCPHCGKRGSWRYDSVAPALEEKDEDGVVSESTQLRTCRKCGKRVLDKWSDHEGRTFEKVKE
jgi:endogenous inhibitor of DNA gyrase (YacG/DUF329 family)